MIGGEDAVKGPITPNGHNNAHSWRRHERCHAGSFIVQFIIGSTDELDACGEKDAYHFGYVRIFFMAC